MATEGERETLATIERLLITWQGQNPRLVGPDGIGSTLPESLYSVLLRAVHELQRGNGVAILAVGHELTTQQAAESLNVSRPYLIGLLEGGEMPFHKVGTHRRIRLEDVVAYQEVRRTARTGSRARSSQEAQDLGLYERLGPVKTPPRTAIGTAMGGITDRLVRALHPSQIILFGSMARGDARPDSDLDLLIVMPDMPSRHKTTTAALRAIGLLDRDVDVLAVSESEVQARGTLPGTAIHDALTEGRVLYARR
ncbi:MAG: excisionase family DNA-binding protein [Chloroflexi bacterium]|nr:excisionase family DNA-binding protein [Chloroflexota bacterium]